MRSYKLWWRTSGWRNRYEGTWCGAIRPFRSLPAAPPDPRDATRWNRYLQTVDGSSHPDVSVLMGPKWWLPPFPAGDSHRNRIQMAQCLRKMTSLAAALPEVMKPIRSRNPHPRNPGRATRMALLGSFVEDPLVLVRCRRRHRHRKPRDGIGWSSRENSLGISSEAQSGNPRPTAPSSSHCRAGNCLHICGRTAPNLVIHQPD